ncbi:NADH:flavin oxidoreductase/NADH oxidase [Bifidobacterium sp. BRDM6]|uniref:NADH:flavin oxidoreductase/NADH oxidase n=2 Tax=Bifidobacterium choloepi TaxID=2614131 RepID=A0A6I5N2H9_9BIFI|nr:NADH:flavin oxidoreductase/NADH oxidase [Bifidobacterium choloepi]
MAKNAKKATTSPKNGKPAGDDTLPKKPKKSKKERKLIDRQLEDIAGHKAPAAERRRAKARRKSAELKTLDKSVGDVLLARDYAFGDKLLRNRLVLPPMCMYSVYAQDGRPTNFHYQHYVSRANGGFGMVIVESTAVVPEGRISPCDLGLWDDAQVDAYRWIVDGIKEAGAVPAIQLSHAGRKASSGCPHLGIPAHEYVPKERGGWDIVGPSPIAFSRDMPVPRELTVPEIHDIVARFRDAARRAVEAGFESIQVHAAHGYLLSEFLDPLVNRRTDEYGGSFENRCRLTLEVVDAVRSVMPDGMPLMVRVSATDWSETTAGWKAISKKLREESSNDSSGDVKHENKAVKHGHGKHVDEARARESYNIAVEQAMAAGEAAADDVYGWDCDQTVRLAKLLKEHGVDLIDVSTGGLIDDVTMPIGPNYQVPYSERIHREADIPTTAVGLITKPKQAEKLLEHDDCTLVEIGRAALREPYWPLRAFHKLGLPNDAMPYPTQYLRGAYPNPATGGSGQGQH